MSTLIFACKLRVVVCHFLYVLSSDLLGWGGWFTQPQLDLKICLQKKKKGSKMLLYASTHVDHTHTNTHTTCNVCVCVCVWSDVNSSALLKLEFHKLIFCQQTTSVKQLSSRRKVNSKSKPIHYSGSAPSTNFTAFCPWFYLQMVPVFKCSDVNDDVPVNAHLNAY